MDFVSLSASMIISNKKLSLVFILFTNAFYLSQSKKRGLSLEEKKSKMMELFFEKVRPY